MDVRDDYKGLLLRGERRRQAAESLWWTRSRWLRCLPSTLQQRLTFLHSELQPNAPLIIHLIDTTVIQANQLMRLKHLTMCLSSITEILRL